MSQYRTIAHSEENTSLRKNIDKTKMKTATGLQQQHKQRFRRTYQHAVYIKNPQPISADQSVLLADLNLSDRKLIDKIKTLD